MILAARGMTAVLTCVVQQKNGPLLLRSTSGTTFVTDMGMLPRGLVVLPPSQSGGVRAGAALAGFEDAYGTSTPQHSMTPTRPVVTLIPPSAFQIPQKSAVGDLPGRVLFPATGTETRAPEFDQWLRENG